jgi:uncharacterized protein YdiU (UPF0061 family)
VKVGSQLTAATYLGLAFLAGGALGASGTYYLTRTPTANATVMRERNSEELRKAYLKEMRERLGLKADQEQHLVQILDQTRELFRQVSDKHRPEFKAIQDHQVEQIRSILDPAQQAEYEKLRAERMDRAKRKEAER